MQIGVESVGVEPGERLVTVTDTRGYAVKQRSERRARAPGGYSSAAWTRLPPVSDG
jgi:hypothetical protein